MREATVALISGPMRALIAALLVGAPIVPIAGAAEDTSVLTVAATGSVEVEPDRVVLRMGATARSESAAQAQDEAGRAVARTVDALEELGLPRRQVRSERVDLRPVRRHDDGDPGEITGYVATMMLEVTLDDASLAGRALDAGIAAGVNVVEGVRFTLADAGDARHRALRSAVRRAREEASVVADALGMRLGEIVDASTSAGGRGPGPVRELALGARSALEPGTITVEAGIEVRFRLLPADAGVDRAVAGDG